MGCLLSRKCESCSVGRGDFRESFAVEVVGDVKRCS